MGLGDYLWPFQRRFRDIPCAREAGIAAFLGGPATGALTLIATGRPRTTFFMTTYSGFAYFWIVFLICRQQNENAKKLSGEFKQALESNKLD